MTFDGAVFRRRVVSFNWLFCRLLEMFPLALLSQDLELNTRLGFTIPLGDTTLVCAIDRAA